MELVKTNKYTVVCGGTSFPQIGHKFEASVLHFTDVSPDWMQVSTVYPGETRIKFDQPVKIEIVTEFGSQWYKALGEYTVKAFITKYVPEAE
jgi:hypothetical protein